MIHVYLGKTPIYNQMMMQLEQEEIVREVKSGKIPSTDANVEYIPVFEGTQMPIDRFERFVALRHLSKRKLRAAARWLVRTGVPSTGFTSGITWRTSKVELALRIARNSTILPDEVEYGVIW